MRIIHLLLLGCFFLSPMAALQAQEETIVADRILRFVNNTVITQGEVWEEMREQFMELRAQGKELPETDEALQAMRREALESLTDNILLSQEADRLEVQLDTVALRREIRTWIRDNNLSPSVTQEAKEITRRSRLMRAGFVLNHYQSQWQAITPSDIQQYYSENTQQFQKPQQAQASRILLRPIGQQDLIAYQRELMSLIQQVQVDATPAVAQAISDEQLSSIVRSSENERSAILRDTLQQVLTAIPANPAARTAQLAAQIRNSLAKWETFRSETQVREKLNAIREDVLQLDSPKDRSKRFAELAKSHSQGPNATNGGDLGLNEIGALDQTLEERIFTLKVGELSSPFPLGEFWCIVFLHYRDDSETRSLREVAPEIRSYLETQRQAAVRASLLAQLRRQGIVRDLEVDPELPAEWFRDQTAPSEPSTTP